MSDPDFMPADSLADNEIEFFALNVPRPGGQHVGMYIAPIVAVHRATGISVTISDVERSQFKTKEKARQRLEAVLAILRSSALTAEERESLEWLRQWDGLEGHKPQSTTGRASHARALAVLDRLLAEVKP